MDELNWELVTEPSQIPKVMEDFGRHQLLGFDFETTGLHYMKDQVHGMGLANPDRAWYITMPVLNQLMPWLKDRMHDPRVQSIGHNVKFDLHFLKKLDPTIKPANIVDTMVAQWLVDENERLGLKHVAEARLGMEGLLTFKDLQRITKADKGFKRMDEVTVYDMDLDLLGKYGAMDPWLGVQMWPELYWDLVQESQEQHFFDTEMPFIFVLQRMEETGFYVYTDKLLELRYEWEKRHTELFEQWCDLTKTKGEDSKYPNGRNPNSNPQLAEWFYDILDLPISFRTEGGAPSTKALAIMRLSYVDESGSANLIKEYRKLDKLLSTYVNPFLEKTYNGYIYGSYNHTGAVTGRLSSSDPNLQNIPAHGETGSQVRRVIGAPPGSLFLMIDYSQIELRLAAHYAQVQALMETFAQGGDPHQTTADLVGVVRYIAKNLNFAWFYGAGPRKFCDMVEEKGYPRPSMTDAKRWFWQFGEAYPELMDWKFAVLRAGKRLGHVRTITKRRRHLPELSSFSERDRGRAERQAVNSIIQGSAGDLIKWAMLQIDPILEDYDARMNSQTHDELGFIVPNDAADEFALIAQQKMVAVEEVFDLSVPILAEPILGQTWGDTKES